jgi:hypothetical protein
VDLAGAAVRVGRGWLENGANRVAGISETLPLHCKCGAGWQPARRLSTAAFGPISNRPQINNLPHSAGNSYRLLNPSRLQVVFYRIDGGLIRSGERCDYGVGVPVQGRFYLVELKGKDLKKAAAQLSGALSVLEAVLRGCTFHCRVVLSRVQPPDLRSAVVIALERRLARCGGDLRRGTILLEESL